MRPPRCGEEPGLASWGPQGLTRGQWFQKRLPSLESRWSLGWGGMPGVCSVVSYRNPLMPGGGNGNPLQYSCLGNPRDRGAWQATLGVAKSRT